MNNLVEIKIVMFEPYRTKSYQQKLTAKKTLAKKITPLRNSCLC